jgi:hypothetical protein
VDRKPVNNLLKRDPVADGRLEISDRGFRHSRFGRSCLERSCFGRRFFNSLTRVAPTNQSSPVSSSNTTQIASDRSSAISVTGKAARHQHIRGYEGGLDPWIRRDASGSNCREF